jgi:hypothetical protein
MGHLYADGNAVAVGCGQDQMVPGMPMAARRHTPWPRPNGRRYAEGFALGVEAAQNAPGRATSPPMLRARPSV